MDGGAEHFMRPEQLEDDAFRAQFQRPQQPVEKPPSAVGTPEIAEKARQGAANAKVQPKPGRDRLQFYKIPKGVMNDVGAVARKPRHPPVPSSSSWRSMSGGLRPST